MAFDITSVLQNLNAAEAEERFEQIELHLLDKNPKNFYSIAGIDELADGIRMAGLLTPIRVKRTESGRYMIISGHRRREAMRRLAENPEVPEWDMHRKVPCIVEPEKTQVAGIEDPEKAAEAGPLMEELRLIFANSDTRQMTSADTATQVRRLREILTALKALGADLPGKLRDHVAAAANISATRVARLDVIEKGLTEPSLRRAWQDGRLGETAAYEIARRSETAQQLAAKRLGAKVLGDMSSDRVAAVMDACEADGNAERRETEELKAGLQRFADASEAEGAPKFDGHGHLEFDADAYLAQREREDVAFVDMLEGLASDFYRELRYVEDRREGIAFIKKVFSNRGGTLPGGDWYDGSASGLRLRRRSEGLDITRTWTHVFDELALAAMRNASEPKVSAADTGATWSTGRPPEIGDYTARVGIGVEESRQAASYRVIHWNGENWVSLGTGVPVKETVFRWIKLPEV